MALSLSRRALSSEYIQQSAQPQPQQPQQQPQQQQQLSSAVQAGWSTYESPERRPSAGERRPAQKARQLSDGQRDLGAGALKTPRPQSPVSARGLEDQRPQRRSLGLPPWKRPTHRVEGQPVTPAHPAAASQPAGRPGQGIPEGGPVVGPAALSAAVPQSSVLTAASRESGWQASLRQVRQELLAQRSAQSEALALEARVRRKELEAQQAAQTRAGGEQVATLRFETELSLRQERESRMGEAAELRAALEQLKAKVLNLQEAERTPTQAGQSVGWTSPSLSGAGQVHELWPPPTQGVEGLARDLEAERLNRCSKDADIHARIGREVSDLGRRLEEQYRALGEAIADASRQMEERRLALEKALETEREDRARESNELRAIVETVWQRAAMVPDAKEKDTMDKKYYFRYDEGPGEESYKELVGDQEDINTLYEMVREALGDTVGLRQEIGEERDDRRGELQAARQQLERLERQFNTLQALVQQATPLASSREHGSPETAERQKSPSASAPTSPGVETRKVRRDSSVETIRNEFATRLEDHRRRLMDHLEDQLAAGQSAQKLHRSEMMGHVEAHMADILRDLSARVEGSEAALRREVRTIVEEVREQLRDVRLRTPTHRGAAEVSLHGAMQDEQQLAAEQALPPSTSSALWQKSQGDPQPPGSGGLQPGGGGLQPGSGGLQPGSGALQPGSGALQVGSSSSLRDGGGRLSMGLNRHFT